VVRKLNLHHLSLLNLPRRKIKPIVRKLKLAPEEDEEATELVTREVKRRKEVDTAVEKALQLAKEIKIPAEVLAKESTVEAAQLGLELTENLQQMAVAGDMVEATEVAQEEAGCSEAAVASEAPEGNTNSLHTDTEIVNIESNTSSDTRSNSTSSSSSTSSDMDDIPLNKVYTTLNKALSPSPSTKTSKKPDYDTFVPMYSFVVERLNDMQQRRIDACKNLLANHPLQPPMIEPIQSTLGEAEGAVDYTGTYSANIDVSSSHPNSPTQTTQTTTQTSEPSIIQNLVNHYSGKLPEHETNQEKASDIASDEVMTESPQHMHQTKKWPHQPTPLLNLKPQ